MTVHQLKCWPEPFKAVLAGHKRHEVRKNDRGYTRGDHVVLNEWDPTPASINVLDGAKGFTGRSVGAVIGHVTEGGTFGLPDDICVFTLEHVIHAP